MNPGGRPRALGPYLVLWFCCLPMLLRSISLLQDWSRQGSRRTTAGPSARQFWMWMAEARRMAPDFIFTECTEDFDACLLHHGLPAYDVHTMILEPQHFGDKAPCYQHLGAG